MFIGAVSLRRVRQSDLESLGARDGFWRSHGQGETSMCFQLLSSLQLPVFRAHEGNVQQPSTKGD